MQNYILDEKLRPTPALTELLYLLDIPHENTLSSVVEATQKSWYQAGKERWEFTDIFPEKKEAALPLLKKLGTIDAIFSSKKQVEYGVLPGATLPSMKERLQTLIEAWKGGVRFKKLVLLAGKRPLRESEKLNDTLKTETDALLYLLDQAKLPEDLKKIPKVVVDTPVKQGLRRPTTIDTIQYWLSFQPEPGSLLVFANQPYVGYFEAIFTNHLPETFSFEVIGKSANEKQMLALFLDTLARWLHQVARTDIPK